MRRIREVFKDAKASDIVKKGKCIIVQIDDKKYVIKEKNDNIYSTYEYLSSRGFKNYPNIVIKNDLYNVYEYIDEISSPLEQKAYDLINIISMLHSKTTYYKQMDIDEYKTIYENISNIIEDRIIFYNNLINRIEIKLFLSPSEYLIERNISKILGALEYSKKNINNWYDLVKTKGKKRVVTLYNNIDLDHVIRNKDVYLVSWDKSKEDIPIYDLYNFYLKYSNILDFKDILKHYEDRYKLLEEEKMLFNILISIPKEIEFNNSEIINCKNLKKIIDSIYRSEVIVSE